MAKPLNQIELGSSCVVKESGQPGTLQRIFHYPTKYLVKTDDGEFQYYNTHEISFEGYDRSKTSLSVPDIPFDGVGSSFAAWVPFQAETQIEHHFLSSKEIVWEMITSLEMYNTWFAGIQRAIADVKSDRYVHKFSFDKLDLKPGSFFKARPATLAPWFRCRIITVEKEKEFGFDFQMTPFYSEYVSFVLEESKKGVFVTCNRFSKGPFSFLALLGWNKTKSKILQRLAEITPTIEIADDSEGSDSSADSPELRAYNVAVIVNKALDGDMGPVNETTDVVTRGKAKAMLIKIKRGSAERPPIPDKVAASTTTATAVKKTSGEIPSKDSSAPISKDDMIAIAVNKALDGDKNAIDDISDKIVKAKSKALLMKIKKGSAERPSLPDLSSSSTINESSAPEPEMSQDDLIALVVNKSLDGDEDALNDLSDKIVKAKAKAMLMKIKKGAVERPDLPKASAAKQSSTNNDEAESDAQLIERLTADGLNGNMDEINALENKILRGKIKAAIVKAKRQK
tara:strand:- start:2823 stop:4358 length:1536 start_codon:yes stop_codon:yes gene_type:complete